MANGMILRGEVYWVSLDDSAGSEIKTGRPAVVISGDSSNEKEDTVIVAFITSGGFASPHNVSVVSPDGKKRVLCRQLRTVDKSRLTKYEYKLSAPEMIRVTGALSGSLCIPLKTPESTPQEKENKEIIALKAEAEMWKRCYDVVMSQLVDLKVNSDLALRMARAGYEYEESEEIEVEEPPMVEEPPVVEEPKEPEEPEQSEEPVEINTCSAEDLKRCGCNPVMIENIINARPYMTLDELRIVSGVTTVGYGLLKRKLCCVPVKVEEPEQKTEESETVVEEPESPVEPEVLEKVNINTATIKEMMNHLGVGNFYAAKISSHRNKNGKFVSLEELRMVEGLPKNFYERYAHLCTIGESESVEEPPVEEVIEEPKPEQKLETGRRLNINTASAQEIHDTLGLSMTVCFSITGTRARNGLYKSTEELRQVPRFAKSHWEKYKDMVTVGEPEEPEEEEPKSDKVNVNTASLRELMAVGFEKRAAALIVNERRKFGRFRSVDDLAEIPEITGKILRKLRDKLEV